MFCPSFTAIFKPVNNIVQLYTVLLCLITFTVALPSPPGTVLPRSPNPSSLAARLIPGIPGTFTSSASSCFGTKPIALPVTTEINWACSQLGNRSYQLAYPGRGTKRVARQYQGQYIVWEVNPRDSRSAFFLSIDECKKEMTAMTNRCQYTVGGKKATRAGWQVHSSGKIMCQMYN